MKKIDLLKLSLQWIAIIAIIGLIVGVGAAMYLIWFMITGHLIFKILFTLTFIALSIIYFSACAYGYNEEEQKFIEIKNLKIEKRRRKNKNRT